MIITLGYAVLSDDTNDVSVTWDAEDQYLSLTQDRDVVVLDRGHAREVAETILTLLDEIPN